MEKKDKLLLIAKERANFKSHLVAYLAVNGFLWLLWFILEDTSDPWPMIVTLGWGIAIVTHYFKAYKKRDWVQKEYTKLLEEENEREYWEKGLYKEENKDSHSS